MKKLLFMICAFGISSAASAQEFGLLAGVHQTSADLKLSAGSGSIDGKMGFKLGLAVDFELMEGQTFRTGLLYNKRMFDASAGGRDYEFDYSYFDIPALYQFNFNEMVGVFGGLVIAFNLDDKVSGTPASDVEAETLVPLLSAGLNLMFDDQLGFDFYYERGLGKFADGTGVKVRDFSTFGANFKYLF